jgi:phosphate-selective porin OprO/OprP
MLQRFTGLVAAAVVGLGCLASPARADDGAGGGGDDINKIVKDEIKAYMKAEKEKKDKEDKEKGTMKVSWKDTVSFESADKKFKAKLIGRIQLDHWTFDADEDYEVALGNEFNTGLFFRRARMGVEMQILKNTKVKIEYDFARGGTDQAFADVYVALVDLDDCGTPLPDAYAGHFKEPFSLDELTSSKYSTFIERALPVTTFAPARNTGLMLEKGFLTYNTAGEKSESFDRLLVQLGVFHAFANNFGDGIFSDDGPDEFAGDQDGWAVTGRIVGVPWYDCTCPDCRVLHVGVAASYRTDLRIDNVRFRSRPEVGFGPRTIDTGNDIVAEDILLLGAEVAFVYDRFSVQGEYIMADVSAPTQDDPVYSGWYAQASYWLTGECRNYKKGKGHFDRVKPCRPFFCEDCCSRGSGAWEVAARFSTVDLNDGVVAVQGGEEWNATVGLNWHINNNVRVMFNYVHAEIDDLPVGAVTTDGTVDAFGVRVAAEW